jgi:putative membrane protein
LSIRKKNVAAHKASMIAAVATSSLFLISYLTYHYHTGSRRFEGEGWIRQLYFVILISHTILAITIVPMVLVTLRRAWTGNFQLHRRIARPTLPLWLYVSVTGVIVYWMLYQL